MIVERILVSCSVTFLITSLLSGLVHRVLSVLCATSIPDTSHRGFSGPPLQDHRKWFSLMGAVCLKKNSFVSQLAL